MFMRISLKCIHLSLIGLILISQFMSLSHEAIIRTLRNYELQTLVSSKLENHWETGLL